MDSPPRLPVQEAGVEESSEVFDLALDVFRDSARPAVPVEEWDRRLREGHGIHFVARQEGRLVSFLTAYESNKSRRTCATHADSDCLHVWMAGTRQDCRGRGVMTSLFEAAESTARRRGLRYLTLNTYPERFPDMFKLATLRWGMCEDVAEDAGMKDSDAGKVFLLKVLS